MRVTLRELKDQEVEEVGVSVRCRGSSRRVATTPNGLSLTVSLWEVATPVVSAGSDLGSVGGQSCCFGTARVGAFVGKLEYPMYHPVPRDDTGPHDAGAQCYQCGKMCKSRRGRTLHQLGAIR